MNVTRVLLDILVVLVAAKAAAELMERVHVPAVVGEILAGILIGPSLLGLVQSGDVLRVLGELGVILLLLDVGLEMDIADLGAVGRSSFIVATIGVIAPFVLGGMCARAFGMNGSEALFVAAALTATSVGITARVFGDLRALATTEARTVLGAAVADDVMGLVILTVVVRVVSGDAVSGATVAAIVAIAVGFLVLTSLVGVRLAPPLFAFVARSGRSNGTLVALALAFTLAIAELAGAAGLAPIVGAFVAGLALGRSSAAPRIRRELTPVGHLFVPVFFLQIGIDARVEQFTNGRVLALAGGLFAVAVIGKLVSAAGLVGARGDRLLVGLGMIPRGEVGLIFATLGLRQHVFGGDVYAALLLVVLATTLFTPPFLRARLLAVRRTGSAEMVTARPPGGWLSDTSDPDAIDLAGIPPYSEALTVAFEAAALAERHRLGPRLFDYLADLPEGLLPLTEDARARFFALLHTGGIRSWRFLVVSGILDRTFPELATALARKQADPFELDPYRALQWPVLSAVREQPVRGRVAHSDALLLAALVLDATPDTETAVATTRSIAGRLNLDAAEEAGAVALTADASLLGAAALKVDSLAEERVLQYAVHLETIDHTRALFALTRASVDLEPWEWIRLDELEARIEDVLAQPSLTGRGARMLVEQRRTDAMEAAGSATARERIAFAPRAYLLATTAGDLVRHAELCEPPPARNVARVAAVALDSGWRVEIASRDRVGLLAREAAAMHAAGLDVHDAVIATWGDGCTIGSFAVTGNRTPDCDAIAADLHARFNSPVEVTAVADVVVNFDDHASPWYTICEIHAPDRRGLLAALTAAFATAGVSVQRATVRTTERGMAVDGFELTDRNGNKVSGDQQHLVRALLQGGQPPVRRRRFAGLVTQWQRDMTSRKQSRHVREISAP